MAVQSDTSRIQYAGNNSTTTSYAVPFVFLENSHLQAIARTSAGVESAVTLTNHTGAGNVNGGTVRTAVAVPATSTLTIFRVVPTTQTTQYQEGGDFPAASHERALDKLTQIAQQNTRQIGNSLRLTEANPIAVLSLPTAAGQHVLATAGSGTAPSFQSLGSLSIGPVIATGSTTPRSVQDRFADVVNVKDFGAVGNGVTDDTVALQAAITFAESSSSYVFIDLAGCRYLISSPLNMRGGQTKIGNGVLKAAPAFAAGVGGSLAMLRLFERNENMVADISFECEFVANGVHNQGAGFTNTYYNLEIDKYKDFGIKIEGSADQRISHCHITQSGLLSALRTGIGIACYNGDVKIHNCTLSYSLINLDIAGNTNLVDSCHFYNGSAIVDVPVYNSINIRITAGANNTFSNCYIDKGRIVIIDNGEVGVGFYSNWIGNKYLFNSGTPEHDSVFVFDAKDTASKPWPADFVHIGSGATLPVSFGSMKFVELIASGAGSWTAEAQAVETLALAFGASLNSNGRNSFSTIGSNGAFLHKTHPDARLHYVDSSSSNSVRVNWANAQLQEIANGFTRRITSSGEIATGSLRLEASRTSTTVTNRLQWVNRRGSNATDIDNTRDAIWSLDAYGASTGTDALRLSYSPAASATETEHFRFTDNGLLFNGGARIVSGDGSPESNVTAVVGSLFLRTNGGVGTTLYVKESGTGNTGWVAK